MGPRHARLVRKRAYFGNFTVLEEQNYVITFSLVESLIREILLVESRNPGPRNPESS